MKKAPAPAPATTGTKAVAPVAPAGEEEKQALEDAGVEVPALKKRATRSAKE